MAENIAIVGTAPAHRLQAPFNDPAWEVWACGPANMDLPRWDKWFEVHDLDYTKAHPDKSAAYLAWLLANQGPKIVAMHQQPAYGTDKCAAYPRAEVLAEFPEDLMTSSIAWMLALAIMQKPKAIGVWGVDMAQTDEYAYQRPACKVLMWEAGRRGIDVVLPTGCDLLLPSRVYGRTPNPLAVKVAQDQAEYRARLARAEQQLAQAQQEVTALRAVLQYADYIKATFG